MTITLKLNDQLKKEIEKLQDLILIHQQKKLTQQEIIVRLIKFSLNFAENIFGVLEEKGSIEADYAWKMLKKPLKWGIKDASIKIDEHLYR